MNKRNIKLVLAYEGTNYAGFQRQRDGIETIQGTLEAAIQKITGQSINLIGAGRTDSGVHANGQVVNFITTSTIDNEKLLQALNAVLPADILVKAVDDVPLEFHARFAAKTKTYSYRIHNERLRPLFNRNFVYHYKHLLDLDLMVQAAQLLVGTHDFKSFQAVGSSVKSTVRTIYFCELTRQGPEIKLLINANGFLYHMVRNIVGTLILVGTKRINLNEVEQILAAKDRSLAGTTAPACGLCLEEVKY